MSQQQARPGTRPATRPDGGHPVALRRREGERWVKVLDQSRCIGCHACTTACKSENEVPLGVTRTYVKSVDVGTFPNVRRSFQVTRCNQCENPPCVAACPTGAMYQRPDGIVDFDKKICVGCKACMAACPYDAIFINPEDHSAEKCNFCAHRLDVGLEPACVVVCPTEAIFVGDLNDPTSKVSRVINREAVSVRKPDKATAPGVFYKGAHKATLDPLAARRPAGSTFMWSEKIENHKVTNSGAPVGAHVNSSATAVVSYDMAHAVPWGWKVSLYTWTKGIAAGVYPVVLVMALLAGQPLSGSLVRYVAPAISLLALAITGILLVADLKHPERFILILIRPQPRSWLVKGGFVLTGYGAALALALVFGYLGNDSAVRIVGMISVLLGAATAGYTAFLFSESRGRDLWQSPLLLPQLLVQAAMLGAGFAVVVRSSLATSASHAAIPLFVGLVLLHSLLVSAEVFTGHPSANAKLAHWEMTRGSMAGWFWLGNLGVLAGVAALLQPEIGVALCYAGMVAYEHSYVRSAQLVPLA
ncbi:MAG: polysulfide reductase NrfD [Actinomycetota bacterium]|nr:polysulfide reductase NrfD [Actinomycetota bacterium]